MFEQGKVSNNEDPEAITGHHSAEYGSRTKWWKIAEAKIIMLFPCIRVYAPETIAWTTTFLPFIEI